ncbi:Pentatricopeptide repeat - like 10 [Theobroma cacao]|nr:Pentatricopeptide repeat - like 10 [Theobroma cacao]
MQRSLLRRVQNYQPKQWHSYNLQSNHLIGTNLPSQNNNASNNVPKQNFETWLTLISTLAEGGIDMDLTLHKAAKLLRSGIKPNDYSLVHLVRVSTDLDYDSYCQQLHCYILKSGFVSNVFVSNALMSNEYSLTVALAACGQLGFLHLGKSIHSNILKCGLECGIIVGNCLMDTYGKCGAVDDAVLVFHSMIDKDVISWNSVLAACARNGKLEEAFSFWRQMPLRDTISYNELISGIAQFGNINDAIDILFNMPNPNSSSWTSIMTGYVNRNRAREALQFFSKMHSNEVELDEFSFSIILSGIAGLSALTWGMLIHCCTIKCGLDTSVVVGSALIDMYSKCGRVKSTESMFQSLPKKNLVTWNAMISGYAHNGDSTKVIQLFELLKRERDLKPDAITFLNVLAACSHNGTPLQEVYQYFESMINDYGIKPTVEHCCSMIRLMGQGGEIWRAERMIYDLEFGSCDVVWRALLGACGVCKDLKVAKIAAAKVIELDGSNDYAYVMMSNIFAHFHKWAEMSVMRKLMRDKRVIKEAGCSWIEMENVELNSST